MMLLLPLLKCQVRHCSCPAVNNLKEVTKTGYKKNNIWLYLLGEFRFNVESKMKDCDCLEIKITANNRESEE